MHRSSKTLFLIFLVFSFFTFSQNFNAERNQLDKKLMVGLGSWATTNFLVSGIGWGSIPSGEAHYFHQMNVMWNVVNIGLAVPGYLKARNAPTELSATDTKLQQKKTEKIYLINAFLDVGYISSGLILGAIKTDDLTNSQRFSGYGKSLIVQGGFLLLFDFMAYGLHKSHATKNAKAFVQSLEVSPSGIGIVWHIPPSKHKLHNNTYIRY